MQIISPPQTFTELRDRARQLAGKKISTIASVLRSTANTKLPNLDLTIPNNLKHAKGWIGQLLEYALGATAGSKAVHDFPELQIEMKTIPLNNLLQPIESTYVCTAPPVTKYLHWQQSWVCKKLQHVLWIPIEADPSLPLTERRVLTPFFWQPNQAQAIILQQDWEELMELLQMGGMEKLSAKYGTYLHIRPKAANSKVLIETYNEHGEIINTVPKGFYLRTAFTRELLLSNVIKQTDPQLLVSK